MRLSLYEFRSGAETTGGNRVVYDVGANTAHFGAAHIEGHALVWQLEPAGDENGALLSRPVRLDPFGNWIARCDRIDFPPGGVAQTHTHPGPGIRYLLGGALEVRTEGRSTFHGPGSAWFESGHEPVYAAASLHEETSFVRVMVLPAEWEGRRTIRYVDPADGERPGPQQATVFLDHALALRL